MVTIVRNENWITNILKIDKGLTKANYGSFVSAPSHNFGKFTTLRE